MADASERVPELVLQDDRSAPSKIMIDPLQDDLRQRELRKYLDEDRRHEEVGRELTDWGFFRPPEERADGAGAGRTLCQALRLDPFDEVLQNLFHLQYTSIGKRMENGSALSKKDGLHFDQRNKMRDFMLEKINYYKGWVEFEPRFALAWWELGKALQDYDKRLGEDFLLQLKDKEQLELYKSMLNEGDLRLRTVTLELPAPEAGSEPAPGAGSSSVTGSSEKVVEKVTAQQCYAKVREIKWTPGETKWFESQKYKEVYAQA